VYWPPLQTFFNTAPLTLAELATCVLLSSAVLFVSEIEKFMARR
jgi:hypothetical protein